MKYTIEAHKRLSFLSEQIKVAIGQWSNTFDKDILWHVAKHSKYGYSMNQEMTDRIKSVERSLRGQTGSNDAYNAIVDYISDLGDSVQNIRSKRREVKEYRPLKDAKKKCGMNVQRVAQNAFQRSNIQTTVGKQVELDVENPENKYAIRNNVTVGISWCRSVFEKGFSIIKSPDGLRLVVRCKYRKVSYVDEDNMNAWHITSIGFKYGKGSIEDGWLVTHKTSECDELHPLVDLSDKDNTVPHSYGLNLSKAYSLMKRRTVRHLVGMLD